MSPTNKILSELNGLFKEVFDDDDLVIAEKTTAADITGWDSLAQIRLVVSIEKLYKIRFSASDVAELKNVGEMVSLIKKKVA